ncbi:hypothetical protein, partial [Rufibacter sp. LB8]|uniref:hypothetical protein n=1 Tax=Rufibacter sp. LB8 TaxID=2777781 RepID=UPI001CEFAFF4
TYLCKRRRRPSADAGVYTLLCGGVLLLFPALYIISVFDLILEKQPENRKSERMTFLFVRPVLA